MVNVFVLLLYRDLKVENLLLDGNQNIKIIGEIHTIFYDTSFQPI